MLTLFEEIFLLCIHEDKGTVMASKEDNLRFGLGGALLARFGLPARTRKHEQALPASAEAATRQSP